MPYREAENWGSTSLFCETDGREVRGGKGLRVVQDQRALKHHARGSREILEQARLLGISYV